MNNNTCPVCELGSLATFTEDVICTGKVRHNQIIHKCDVCGYECVSASSFNHNMAQPVTEIEGPFKPIEIAGIHNANAYFDWGWTGRGFGQLSFSFNRETGKITCNNECMSRESVRELLRAFADHIADNCILEDE